MDAEANMLTPEGDGARDRSARCAHYPEQAGRVHRRDEDRAAAPRLGLRREHCAISPSCSGHDAGELDGVATFYNLISAGRSAGT